MGIHASYSLVFAHIDRRPVDKRIPERFDCAPCSISAKGVRLSPSSAPIAPPQHMLTRDRLDIMHRLHYSVILSYEVVGDAADFIFNIEAARTSRQTILSETLTLPKGVRSSHFTDPTLANRFFRLHTGAGHLEVRYEALVQINHRFENPRVLEEERIKDVPFDVLPYLSPSRYAQSDQLMEFALQEFGRVEPGYGRALAIRDWVRDHVRFKSSSSNESTSAVDTLIQRTGVCRDFANLMMALCRALSIPARFASSLDYGADPAMGPSDFHAFVEVFLSGRWYLLDPSGNAIPTGLIRIGTARDASDVPFASIFGKVLYRSPVIKIQAVLDDSQDLFMPTITDRAISTW